jgi:hypothetical protein
VGGVGENDACDAEKPWHVTRPELLDDVRAALTAYPMLHLFPNEVGAEIRGTFPVRGTTGEAIDEYQVRIELPAGFPDALPIVHETGGRIPSTLERHAPGFCCVLLPDARWEEFPVGAPFRDYLAGPLHNYFLGQSTVELRDPWPFGEWGHGNDGRLEYYKQLFGTNDRATVRRFLEMIGWPHGNRRPRCPCGSGRRLSRCCLAKVKDLRRKLPRKTARRAFESMGFHRLGLHLRM